MFDFSTITEVRLASGAHKTPEEGMCAMEMVAWFHGEPHSDRPKCTSPVLASYVRTLNDRMPDDVRDRLLKPMLPHLVGTVSPEHEQARAESLVGLVKEAEKLLAARTIDEGRAAARAAACAGWELAIKALQEAINIVPQSFGFAADPVERHAALRELDTVK